MSEKKYWVQSAILASFLTIPLFRPIMIFHGKIIIVYGLFLLAFLVLLINLRLLLQVNRAQLLLLGGYCVASMATTLLIVDQMRWDIAGLLFFLFFSFILGSSVAKHKSEYYVLLLMAWVFIPIALYIAYNLSQKGFSYNKYYYWSSAAYKIDYLTSSLYACILFIYFYFNGKGFVTKYILTGFCFVFIAISGARYSIMFSGLAVLYFGVRQLRTSPVKLILTALAGVFLLGFIVVFNEDALSASGSGLEYSIFRLMNMFGDDDSIDGRLRLIEESRAIINNNFLFGVGIAGSGEVLHSVYPHNFLLESFVDSGFFSTLLLFLFFALSVIFLFRVKVEKKVWIVLIFLYLLGGFLKSFSLYEARILFFFSGYLSYLMANSIDANGGSSVRN